MVISHRFYVHYIDRFSQGSGADDVHHRLVVRGITQNCAYMKPMKRGRDYSIPTVSDRENNVPGPLDSIHHADTFFRTRGEGFLAENVIPEWDTS